jgi:hypothetical protein
MRKSVGTLGRIWAVAGAGWAASLGAQEFPLALELDGTRVTLGSTVELVARTTAARALSSADFQFEVRDRDGLPAVAFDALVSFELLGGGAGSTIDATFDVAAQRLTVSALSPDMTMNSALGPLAVFRFSLDPSVQVDDRFEVWLDPDTDFVDAAAERVVTEVGRADLRIVEDEPGQGLGALGGEAFPGGPVVLGAISERPFAIGSGTIELFYDATLFSGPPLVVIDPRYGTATIDAVGNPEPGHLIVDFSSAGGDLNLPVHGAFFQVLLEALASVPIGTVSTVALGPATALEDPAGDPIVLETDGESLDFIDPELVAAAGFEAGGLTEWWNVVD